MLIRLENIYKIYGEGLESEVRALDGVSLTIDRGEFVAIAGASGSGKSTMMNVLGCLDIPTYGEYWLDGQNVRELTDKQLSHIRNKQIGFIFQGYNLIPELTALENVELPLIYQGIGPGKRQELAQRALERVGAGQPRRTPALGNVWRPAAACGHCPGYFHQSAYHYGRRTHGSAGFQNRAGGAGVSSAAQS